MADDGGAFAMYSRIAFVVVDDVSRRGQGMKCRKLCIILPERKVIRSGAFSDALSDEHCHGRVTFA